ncbi:MAG TPA: pyrimidine reductase family protein [Mycobacterium sp.]|nr:pyrimidine reductase family protein [Mycobacterium sp.]
MTSPATLPTAPAELAVLYAYPAEPSGGCLVRANMVSSLDGASALKGTSTALGSPGDKAVFDVLRGLADVVLVASGTVAAEHYGPAEPNAALAAQRGACGQRPAAVLAVVTGRLSLDPESPVARAAGTLVLTCATAPEDRRRALVAAGADVIDCGVDTVDLNEALRILAERGLWRVLCEGGPSLLGSMVVADLLDEICLTYSPHLVGGEGGRILHSSVENDGPPMQPVHVLADDQGFLYTRWRRSTLKTG